MAAGWSPHAASSQFPLALVHFTLQQLLIEIYIILQPVKLPAAVPLSVAA